MGGFSEQLNGYLEEGYHYYLEFRDGKLTVRRYDRVTVLTTDVSYDAAALDEGERTVITLADGVLSRSLSGEPMSRIRDLVYENGELTLVKRYLEEEDTAYTLHKVDHGPFAHIIIRDEAYLDRLQGEWKSWPKSDHSWTLQIKGNHLNWEGIGESDFHVVSYTYNPNAVKLVPYDLTQDSFRGFTAFTLHPDMLETTMMVYDMSVPSTIFAREDRLDSIIVPGSARRKAVNTMNRMPGGGFSPLMGGFMGMGPLAQPTVTAQPRPEPDPEKEGRVCPCCGYDWKGWGENPPKFCPECGTRL